LRVHAVVPTPLVIASQRNRGFRVGHIHDHQPVDSVGQVDPVLVQVHVIGVSRDVQASDNKRPGRVGNIQDLEHRVHGIGRDKGMVSLDNYVPGFGRVIVICLTGHDDIRAGRDLDLDCVAVLMCRRVLGPDHVIVGVAIAHRLVGIHQVIGEADGISEVLAS